MKKLICIKGLLLLSLLFVFSCKKDKDIDDLVSETQAAPNIENLKENLSGEAIHFFDLDYLSTHNPNIEKASNQEKPIAENPATSREIDKRQAAIEIVYNALLQQNASQEFVTTVIDEIGYPIWDKSILAETTGNDFQSLILPFAKINDDYISSEVLINIIEDVPVFFIRADKPVIDQLIADISFENTETEEIPFHVAAYLQLDLELFDSQDQSYLDWLGGEIEEESALDRCVSGTTTICYNCDCAAQSDLVDAAAPRCECCVTVSINCDSYDGNNGDVGGSISSGISFPGSNSGGSSTNNNSNTSHTEAQELLEICNNHLNATGDEGNLPDLLPTEVQACQFLTDILTLVALSDEEILWLNQNHINNNGFFSHLTLIRAYLLSDAFDSTSAKDQEMFSIYMGLMVEGAIDMPITHFAHLYDFKHEYDLEMSYAELADIIDESECINSGSFDDCARNKLFSHQLGLLDDITEIVNQDLQDTGIEKVYFNRYGYHGYLQYVDGYWIYERPPGWIEGEEFVHFIYLDGKWELYDPPVFPDDMHFLSAFVEVLIQSGHNSLDLFGLIPVAGEVADGINSAWYYAEGDLVNGSLSAASMVPFAGYAANAVKWGRNSLKLSDGVFYSAEGLQFARRYYGSLGFVESALTHVFRHTKDDLTKAFHGVFNDLDDVAGILDDGWRKVLNNSPDIISDATSGGRRVIHVNMGTVIGKLGGSQGNGQSINKLLIVLEAGTNNIITAYPKL